MKTKCEQIIDIQGGQPPTTIVKLFWDVIHNLIAKDIDSEGEVFKAIDGMMKDIEKGKRPSCTAMANAVEDKLELVKEVFKLRNGGEKKPDWNNVLKELKKYKRHTV